MQNTASFIASITRLSLCAIGLLVSCTSARAVPQGVSSFSYEKDGVSITIDLDNILKSVLTPPSVGLIPPVAIIFKETAEMFTLQIAGGDFDTDSTQTFTFDGTYWDGVFGVSQDSGFLLDILNFSGNFAHALGPHVERDNPVMMFSDPFFPGSIVFNPEDGIIKHSNGHIDTYTGTIDATGFADITTWNFFLKGVHSGGVPTPDSSPSVILLTAIFVMLLGLRRRREC